MRDAFVPPDGATVYSGNGHAYLIVVPATPRDGNA